MPEVDELDGNERLDNARLAERLSCARVSVGKWSDYGVRTLINEQELYASVQLRIPSGLPTTWATRLAEFATQHIPYTDRDREWDSVSRYGLVTSTGTPLELLCGLSTSTSRRPLRRPILLCDRPRRMTSSSDARSGSPLTRVDRKKRRRRAFADQPRTRGEVAQVTRVDRA
ncbi:MULTISPECIES: hypothetical protein [unclassified Microbacterium]|uniref:hypothetical protein n=1 Tax=unclassified Microbacterium TaxID=2609290 RepID=UPI00109C29B5|nr:MULTISPECIES: hypothetical protein [unclassified Microbacterium]